MWADIITKNRAVVAEVIKEALSTAPDYPAGVQATESIAHIAMKKQGYEEALKNIFSTIPGDRTMPFESKFMDMTT